MPTIPLSSISVAPGRQRTTFDDTHLNALSDSIRSVGLLQPLVVRRSDGKVTLVAGERRLRAIENLSLLGERVLFAGSLCPEGHAPVTDIGELDPARAWEAELEENIRRVDLTWQERTAAEARLIQLRRDIARAEGAPLPTLVDIGRELSPNIGEHYAGDLARQSLVLQSKMHIPEIAKAATQREAWKIHQRLEQGKRDEALGQAVGRESIHELFRVFHEDARTWLARNNDSFDCILIDPPYGMGANSFRDAGGKLSGISHGYEDSAEHALSLMRDCAPLLFARGAAESHLYVWCDIDQFCTLKAIFAGAGYWVHRTPLINIKREGGRIPWPEHGPRRCYELVLYAVKGKRPVTAIHRDVFESTLERDTDGHGAAKPVEAYIDLLKRSCRPGDSVLDCFAGTGTVLAAAAALKLRATAVELDPSYYGQCLRRLEGLAK